jgi:disulfide oxidoreductase YuzD
MISDVPKPGAVSPSGAKDIVSSDANLNDFMLRMVNLNNSGIFHEPNCHICASEHRAKSEKMWLDTRNAESIRQFFIDKGVNTLTIPMIKNHMESHLDQSQEEIRKREYIDKLISINDGGKVSTIDRLDMALTTLNERLVSINALVDACKPLSEVEKIKADLTCKITGSMDRLFKLRAEMLGEMRRDGEAFAINKREFVETFKSLLDGASTEEEKFIINKVFSELHKICREE